jgi:hypothetical protein
MTTAEEICREEFTQKQLNKLLDRASWNSLFPIALEMGFEIRRMALLNYDGVELRDLIKQTWREKVARLIVSVEERISKTTLKPYVVVKARMVFFGNLRSSPLKKLASKIYTMMCFNESLFGLFETGNQHLFEGELSFDWGNTWIKIMKLFDDSGNRLLRPTKTEDANAYDEKIAESIGKNVDCYLAEKREAIQRGNGNLVCSHICEECLDYDTSGCPLY